MSIEVQLIVLALAAARLTLLLTSDVITERLREAVFLVSPPVDSEYLSYKRVGLFKYEFVDNYDLVRKPGFWGQVASCADCAGVWVSAVVVIVWVTIGHIVTYTLAPFAIAMIVSLIARRY